MRTYTPPHLSSLSVSTVPRTEYVTFRSFRGSRLKEAGDERDTTEQTHTTAASSPPRRIEWVLTDCVYRTAKSPLFSTLGRGHVGEVSVTQIDLLGQRGDRRPLPLVRQPISKDCSHTHVIYFIWLPLTVRNTSYSTFSVMKLRLFHHSDRIVNFITDNLPSFKGRVAHFSHLLFAVAVLDYNMSKCNWTTIATQYR